MLYISYILLHKNTVRVLGCFSQSTEKNMYEERPPICRWGQLVYIKSYILNSNTVFKKVIYIRKYIPTRLKLLKPMEVKWKKLQVVIANTF